jgi:endonuclease-3
MAGRLLTLEEAVGLLGKHFGSPARPPTADPFELILLENVAYLAPPARRHEAFEHLKRKVGTSPRAILLARPRDLESVTARGVLKRTFAAKLRECARIAIEDFGGDLRTTIRGQLDTAVRALRSFPGIGEPGAEKVLLFAGRHASLAPDSNGLRVLVRLGLVREEKSYAKTYAASRHVAQHLHVDTRAMQDAHLLLRLHGQTLCRRNAPHCRECPLASGCAHARRERRAPPRRLARAAGAKGRARGEGRGT